MISNFILCLLGSIAIPQPEINNHKSKISLDKS
jgi:hypothetical protein